MAVVEQVISPDQIVVAGKKVRVAGIVGPRAGDVYYRAAVDLARVTLLGKEVELVPDPVQRDKDPFGRLIRYVMLDGQSYSVIIARAGFAVPYVSRPPATRHREIRRAVEEARVSGAGMWA